MLPKIIDSIRSFVYRNMWTIGIIEADATCILKGQPYDVHWIRGHLKSGWLADPFILFADTTRILLLVEEYVYSLKRGRISLVQINRENYHINRIQPILELDTHLSFPAFYRCGNKIMMYPENGEAGKLFLYELSPDEFHCKKIGPISLEKHADAIITNIFGENIMFSTLFPNYNSNVLTISTSHDGLFVPSHQIKFDSNCARNAGNWFELGGRYYRPAQDCNEKYGAAVILQEIKIVDNSFNFVNVARIESTNKRYNTGCHTFNSEFGISVIDAHGLRFPILVRLCDCIRQLYWIIKGQPQNYK